MPGAHKIGAAISGPRITGGNFMDTILIGSWMSAPWGHGCPHRNASVFQDFEDYLINIFAPG